MRLFWLWILPSIQAEYAAAHVGAGAAAGVCVAGSDNVLRMGADWDARLVACAAMDAEEEIGDASEERGAAMLESLLSNGIRLTNETNWLDVV